MSGRRPWENSARSRAMPSTPKVQPESKFARDLRAALTNAFPESKWLKMHGSEFMENGISDIIGVVNGRFVAVEVKVKSGWFSAVQIRFIRQVEAAGGVAIGYLRQDGKHYIIPSTAMGDKGNRHHELWVEIKFPSELNKIMWSMT